MMQGCLLAFCNLRASRLRQGNHKENDVLRSAGDVVRLGGNYKFGYFGSVPAVAAKC